MVIYADVLLAVNLYINYFLVRCTCLLLRRKVTHLRCFLACGAGTLGALVIFLPELHPVVNLLFRAALGVAVTFILFGRQKRVDLLISLLCFLAVSFGFAGGMLALWYFAAPLGMYYGNGTAYFDIPIIAAAAITAGLFGAFRLAGYIMDRRRPASHAVVKLRRDGAEVTLDGLADTGNSLRDSFSGKPVILASLHSVEAVAPDAVLNYLSGSSDMLDGIRLVPCRTITSDGVVPVFPAEVTIDGRRAEALVGVSRMNISGADCIFDPDIISKN